MKWVGYREFAVAKLKLPGEIAKRMKEPRVEALAASADDLGGAFMHAPTVNSDVTPPELVAGRDRMAATLLRKRKKVWCHVGVDWTPEDLVKAEIGENLHRRPEDRDALRADLVGKLAALLPGKAPGNARGAGRPLTPTGEAQRMVAAAEGTTTEAIRASVRRVKDREEGAGRHGAQGEPATGSAGERPSGLHESPAAPPIDLHGHAMPAHMLDVGAIVKQFAKVDQLLKQAKAAAGDIGMYASVPAGLAERVTRAINDVTDIVRAEKPSDLCPKCNGESHPITGPLCSQCQERGWVRRDAFAAAPKKVSAEEFVSNLERAAGLDAPEPGDCAHAYRKGAKPTGVCLTCGAGGAETWTEAEEMARGLGAPPHDANDPGWVAHGPGSDRHPIDKHLARAAAAKAPAKAKRGPKVVIANADGTETEVGP